MYVSASSEIVTRYGVIENDSIRVSHCLPGYTMSSGIGIKSVNMLSIRGSTDLLNEDAISVIGRSGSTSLIERAEVKVAKMKDVVRAGLVLYTMYTTPISVFLVCRNRFL